MTGGRESELKQRWIMTAMPKWVAQLSYRLWRKRTGGHFIWNGKSGKTVVGNYKHSDALPKKKKAKFTYNRLGAAETNCFQQYRQNRLPQVVIFFDGSDKFSITTFTQPVSTYMFLCGQLQFLTIFCASQEIAISLDTCDLTNFILQNYTKCAGKPESKHYMHVFKCRLLDDDKCSGFVSHVGCIWQAAVPHMGMSLVNPHLEFFCIHGGIASILSTSKCRHTRNMEETAMYKKVSLVQYSVFCTI